MEISDRPGREMEEVIVNAVNNALASHYATSMKQPAHPPVVVAGGGGEPGYSNIYHPQYYSTAAPPFGFNSENPSLRAILAKHVGAIVEEYLKNDQAKNKLPELPSFYTAGTLPIPLYYPTHTTPGATSLLASVCVACMLAHAIISLLSVSVSQVMNLILLCLIGLMLFILEASFIPGNGYIMREAETWCRVIARPRGRAILGIVFAGLYASTVKLTIAGLIGGGTMVIIGLHRLIRTS